MLSQNSKHSHHNRYVKVDKEFSWILEKHDWYIMKRHETYALCRYRNIQLHRQLAEIVLGRALSKGEYVAHKNKNALDNRLANLCVFQGNPIFRDLEDAPSLSDLHKVKSRVAEGTT